MVNESNLSSFIKDRITELRNTSGLTRNGLAMSCGISQSYIRELENGEKTNISVDKLFSICQTLNISLKDFFDEDFLPASVSPLQARINSMSETQQERLLEFLNSVYF